MNKVIELGDFEEARKIILSYPTEIQCDFVVKAIDNKNIDLLYTKALMLNKIYDLQHDLFMEIDNEKQVNYYEKNNLIYEQNRI